MHVAWHLDEANYVATQHCCMSATSNASRWKGAWFGVGFDLLSLYGMHVLL